MTGTTVTPQDRLTSLDVFRGITMFLLVAEQARIYESLGGLHLPEGTWGAALLMQFDHHPWNGLRFWDLVQPFFMFIVGVAMPFSFGKRWDRGDTWLTTFRHVVFRCFMLFLFGTGLHCGYRNHLTWELWNVLTQLSFTIMVAFLIMRAPIGVQLAISLVLLLGSDLAYRFWPIGEYRDLAGPFVADKNFGTYMDEILMAKIKAWVYPGQPWINRNHWVVINCIPTAAHTIWGVIAGMILKSARQPGQKLSILGITGIIALVLGYGMDFSGLEPIVKRICTVSFIFASGGWCLVVLAFSYWFVDLKGFKRWTLFFCIVGMNPIFIYLFSESVGRQWFNNFVFIFVGGFAGLAGVAEAYQEILSAFITLGLEWYLCYWLYKRKIFFRI